jgi:hypothetical protein
MATAVAALMAKARREIEDKFFDNNAFSADRAVEIEPRVPVQQRFLDQLLAENIVHQVGPKLYWLDLKAYEKMRRARMIAALWIVALFLVVLGVVTLVKQIH